MKNPAVIFQKSIKNRQTNTSKTRCNFELIFDGSQTNFGSILDAKLEPSWHQNRSKMASKSISKHGQKIDRKSGTQGHASRRRKSGCWPLKNSQSQCPQGPQGHQGPQGTPLRARGTVADIYISNCLRHIRHRAWDCCVRQ